MGKKGTWGNGIQCASRQSGVMPVAPDTIVTVTAKFSRDWVQEVNNEKYPEQTELFNEIESLNGVCSATSRPARPSSTRQGRTDGWIAEGCMSPCPCIPLWC